MTRHTNPQSWLPPANEPACDFPLTHLPYGAFQVGGEQHLCVAIGNHLLDLHQCATAALLPAPLVPACQSPVLNLLMSHGPSSWEQLRHVLTHLLSVQANST